MKYTFLKNISRSTQAFLGLLVIHREKELKRDKNRREALRRTCDNH